MSRGLSVFFSLLLPACATPRQLEDYAERLDHDLDGVFDVIDCSPEDPDVQGLVWHLDSDGDGHGDPGSVAETCARPADGRAWVQTGDDCNDRNPLVFETRTGFRDDDQDGFGRGLALLTLCDGGEALATRTGDCEDADPEVFPGAPAVCGNGKDDDCDAAPDCDAPEGEVQAIDADARWSGDGEQALGATVAVAGDVDGDGFDDVVVGAPDDRGAAYVIGGPFDGEMGMEDASAVLTGTDGSAAGSAISGAGDVDGDGYDDFLVGAPGGAGGAAVLVYGPMRAVEGAGGAAELSTASLDMVELRLNVDDADEAGASLAAPGDLRGNDGEADLVIGAPGGSAVYVVRGPLDADVSLGEDGGVAVISGAANLDLGRGLSTIGDLDGDGRAELTVGAPGYSSSFMGAMRGDPGVGAVYVFFEVGDLDVEDADVRILGEEEGSDFGASLADGGDVDGDGLGDLMVGAPDADEWRGAAWLFTGAVLADASAPGLEDAEAYFYGSEDVEWAGTFMLGGADVDFDGQQDLLIGSPAAKWGTEPFRGAVGVWYGPQSGRHSTENADTQILGELQENGASSLLGWSMAFAPMGDLIVGAPGIGAELSEDSEHNFGDGAVYTFHLGW